MNAIRSITLSALLFAVGCTAPGTIQMESPPPARIRSAWVTTSGGAKVQLHRPYRDRGDYVGWVDSVRGRKLRRIPLDSIVRYRYHSDLPTLSEGATWVAPPAGNGQAPNVLGEFFAEALVAMLFALPGSLYVR